MDERLKKALDISNYMVTLNNQKRLLKDKFYENSVHYCNGGQFSVTKELISFCFSLKYAGQEYTVLIDDNDIPIEIDDLEKFLKILILNILKQQINILLSITKLKQTDQLKVLWIYD